MKIRKYISFLLLILPGFFFTSYGGDDEEKQDDPAPEQVVAKCLLNEQYYDSTKWMKNYYDASNNIISQDYRDGNRQWKYTSVFDSNNKLIEHTQVQTNGSGYFSYTYTYNTFGLKEKVIFYFKQNNSLVKNRTLTYTYTANGQLSRKDTEFNYTGDPSVYTLYTFSNNKVIANSYTISGALGTIEEYEFDNNKTPSADIPSSTFFNEFQIPHNIIKYTWKDASGFINPTFSYTATFTFNAGGYPIQRVEKDVNGNVKTNATFTYNCK
jgi:hypothetical protein